MDPAGWWWLAWLGLAFLPRELWAAAFTPGRPDTFSEWIWRVLGVPRKAGPLAGRQVPWARGRRTVFLAFWGALGAHLAFGWSVVPVVVFGAALAAVIAWAVLKERDR